MNRLFAASLLAGLGGRLSPMLLKPKRAYGPCVGCGNPAKDNHCHKCRTKLSASIQASNQIGTPEPGTIITIAPSGEVVRISNPLAEPTPLATIVSSEAPANDAG